MRNTDKFEMVNRTQLHLLRKSAIRLFTSPQCALGREMRSMIKATLRRGRKRPSCAAI